MKETTWRLGLHLDERPRGALALELWLHADDDPTLSLPVSLLWEAGDDAFAFVRSGDPLGDLERDLDELRPLLATEGIEFDEEQPFEVELDAETVSYFLRDLMPRLDERDVPVALPSAWLRAPTRLRANVTARSEPYAQSSGLLSTSVLASFDWRLAVGDTELTDEELRALAAAKSPVVQVDGRWQAVRAADVKRALRFLERRQQGVGFVQLVRAVSGLETDEAGLELGTVQLDRSLDELLSGKDARFRPRGTPAGMRHDLFPFQEKGHGWLRMLGDLGIGAILADDMGLGKTVQAIAMLVSEREEAGAEAFGPTLVVCPMSVARQWVAEVHRFAPGLRVHLHHGSDRLANEELHRKAHAVDVVVTSYDIATRDVEALAERRLGPADHGRGAGREEPADEARAGVADAAGAAAGRDDGHADREPAERAVGDHGHPQSGPARLARVVQPDVRAADRGGEGRGGAGAAAGGGAAVHPAAGEGRAGGRARPAADHGREGLLQADDRAGEPLPGDGRPLVPADRAARGPVRSPRRGARDARAPEAGVQPPGDADAHGRAARRPLGQAGAAGRAAAGDAGRRQGARLHAVPELRPPRAVPRGEARTGRSASSTGG